MKYFAFMLWVFLGAILNNYFINNGLTTWIYIIGYAFGTVSMVILND